MYFQSSILISALASFAAAGPIEVRQLGLGGTGTTSKEFSTGGCRDILFAWARGSTEIGNMVGGSCWPRRIKLTSIGYRCWSSHLGWTEGEVRRQRCRDRGHRLCCRHWHKRHSRRHRCYFKEADARYPQLHGTEVPRLSHCNGWLLPRCCCQPPCHRRARHCSQGPDRWCRPLR